MYGEGTTETTGDGQEGTEPVSAVRRSLPLAAERGSVPGRSMGVRAEGRPAG